MTEQAGEYGNTQNIGIFGETLVGFNISDVNVDFSAEKNTTYDLAETVTGDGAVSHVGSLLVVASTTGTARAATRRVTRYRAGHTGLIQLTASFAGNGTGIAGGFDSETGFFIKFAAGVPYFCYRNSSVDYCFRLFDYIEGFSTASIDWGMINIFEIEYGYLGVASPSLYIYPFGRGRTLLSRIETQGALETTHVSSPKFPVAVESSGAMTVKCGSMNAGTYGPDFEAGVGRPFHFFANAGALSGTTLKTLGNFRCKSTFNSRTNRKSARLLAFEFFVDIPATGDGTVEFHIYKNAVTSGTPVYSDVSAGNSVVEIDTTAQYVSDGYGSVTKWVSYIGANKGGGAFATIIDADKFGLEARPGDVFTITAQNVVGATAVNVRMSFNWEEY